MSRLLENQSEFPRPARPHPEEPGAPPPAFKRPSPWNKIDQMKRGGTAPLHYKKTETGPEPFQDMSTTAGSNDKHSSIHRQKEMDTSGLLSTKISRKEQKQEAPKTEFLCLAKYRPANMAETLSAIFGRKERKPVKPMRKIKLKGISDEAQKRRQGNMFKSYLFSNGAVPGNHSCLIQENTTNIEDKEAYEEEAGLEGRGSSKMALHFKKENDSQRKRNIEMLLEGIDGTSTIQSFIHQNEGFKTIEIEPLSKGINLEDKWGTGKLAKGDLNFYDGDEERKEFLKTESNFFKKQLRDEDIMGRTDTFHPLNYFSDTGNQQKKDKCRQAYEDTSRVKRTNTSDEQLRASLSSNRKEAVSAQRPIVRNVIRRKSSKVKVRRLFLDQRKGDNSDGEPVPLELAEQTQKFHQLVERPPARHKAIPTDIDDGCPFVVKSASFLKSTQRKDDSQPLQKSCIAAAQSAQLQRPPSRHKTPPKAVGLELPQYLPDDVSSEDTPEVSDTEKAEDYPGLQQLQMWARKTPQTQKKMMRNITNRDKQIQQAQKDLRQEYIESGRREKSLYDKYLEDTSLFNPTKKKNFRKHQRNLTPSQLPSVAVNESQQLYTKAAKTAMHTEHQSGILQILKSDDPLPPSELRLRQSDRKPVGALVSKDNFFKELSSRGHNERLLHSGRTEQLKQEELRKYNGTSPRSPTRLEGFKVYGMHQMMPSSGRK